MKLHDITCKELLSSNQLARGLAIFMVMACHIPNADPFWSFLKPFACAGKLGVAIFLFSSGLLLQYQANKPGTKLDLVAWLKRRAFRIYPLYWIGLVVALAIGTMFKGQVYGAGALFLNAVGIPLLFRVPIISAGYVMHFWFISVLFLCYLLFIVFYRMPRKEFLVAFALVLSFISLRSYFTMASAALAFPAFFFGMFVGDRLRQRGEKPVDARVSAVIFMILLATVTFVFKYKYFISIDDRYLFWIDALGCVGMAFIALPALYVIAMIYKYMDIQCTALLKYILLVSGISYGAYCIHEPMLVILEKFTVHSLPWLGLACYFVLTLLFAWGLERLVGWLLPKNGERERG